ncbi:hypothetical protein M422DRAFT_242649 [Sphaerobolus stellatus SS14]|nr:hypothetical protein M422DRAFT_242649 [Sphaerobolus stellatus SS14]
MKCLVFDPVPRTDTGDKPSVLQCLIYWIASVMELGGENALTSGWIAKYSNTDITDRRKRSSKPDEPTLEAQALLRNIKLDRK